MEIYLGKRSVNRIRQSAEDAIEEGDIEALREDVHEAFSEEQVDDIERHLDNGDFFEFLTDMLDEWNGDNVDELFELLEIRLGELGMDFSHAPLTSSAPNKTNSSPHTEGTEEENDSTADEDDD